MALSRPKKRVLAQLLVREAKRIAAEWDLKSSKWRNGDHGEVSLSDVEKSDVEELFAGWLKHLPDGAWEKVETPSVDDTVGHTSETYNSNSGAPVEVSTNYTASSHTANTFTNADRENTAVSPETPIMGDNDLHDEDDVLAIEDEDATGSEDPAQHGGRFPEAP